MCPIQSNKDQTISICRYLCPFKSVQDLISTHRDLVRIKAAIVLYEVKKLFGRTSRIKKEEKGRTTEVQRMKKKKKSHTS